MNIANFIRNIMLVLAVAIVNKNFVEIVYHIIMLSN